MLVERGLVESRQKARALIMAGRVVVDGAVADKPGREYRADCRIEIKEGPRYASRGGLKLEGALDRFGLDVRGLRAMDVGSSTGGFTDCLLQRGAAAVWAVDVGRGLLDWRLRRDGRVRLLEGVNVRNLARDAVTDPIDLAVIDVSFISLEKVLPKVREFLAPGARVLALVKPQFEVGRGQVEKGGVVRDPAKHRAVVEKIKGCGLALGFRCLGTTPSPIRGAKGNVEFWVLFAA
ncbi:MAG TPA: TlyA family RNA methyltransferase [Deltaproteobacteria bacterium]|nr:TlyA family RNA methyltransferase [Deltaproteobacteria bacterium]